MITWLQDGGALRIYGIFFLYVFSRGVLFCSFFFWIAHHLNGRLRIVAPKASRSQLRSELIANLKVNLLETLLFPSVIYFGLIQVHHFSWLRFISTFGFCYVFYEFWFYGAHRFLHSAYGKSFHRQHHRSVVTTPLSAQSVSLPEKFLNGVGLYLIPCLLTFWFPLVFEGIIAYHLYNYFVNVLGHSNLEFFLKGYENTKLGRILTTPTYHSLHHTLGEKNYGLFTSGPDKLFGTYEVKYPELFNSHAGSP